MRRSMSFVNTFKVHLKDTHAIVKNLSNRLRLFINKIKVDKEIENKCCDICLFFTFFTLRFLRELHIKILSK